MPIDDSLITALLRLPDQDLRNLADAAQASRLSLTLLATGSPIRTAARFLHESDIGPDEAAGIVRGVLATRHALDRRIDLVWTGPTPAHSRSRSTSATLEDLVDRSLHSVMLIGYVVHGDPALVKSFSQAAARGVEIDFLTERSEDNPVFRGASSEVFPTVRAKRWYWPSTEREPGASLHAKVLVVDRRWCTVGSANITASALAKNFECGVLLDRPDLATKIHNVVEDLIRQGVFRRTDARRP